MNMEISAGGIIAWKSRVWHVLIMKDGHGNWTFPKGKVETGEELRETALREISEEVGLRDLTFISVLTPLRYWYFRVRSIQKTVHYFLYVSSTRQVPIVQTEEGITEARWVTFSEAEKMIGYPDSNRPLLKEAHGILKESERKHRTV